MIRALAMSATALAVGGCSQGSTYLVDSDGDYLQPDVVTSMRVTGYFSCATPGRSCKAQAAEPCGRYNMNVRSVGPMDVEIPVKRSGFNFFPIQPNRKVICARPLETKA